jgi:hypothetical protein
VDRDVFQLVRDGAAVGVLQRGIASASVSPGVATRSTAAGIDDITSGVRPSGSGSSEGSPRGSLPSGSRCAARCP